MADTIDEDEFKETALFKKMLADAPAVIAEAQEFDKQYADLIQHDHATVGTILRCHLVVEHYLNAHLIHAHPGIVDFKSARLTFAQKLALASHPRTNVAMMMPALKSLNHFRNQLAHTLDVDVSSDQIQPIEAFVKMWRTAGGYEVPKGLAAIQDFTLTACILLSGATGIIKRYGKGRGLIGAIEWYADKT
jgi:hypothetical protein